MRRPVDLRRRPQARRQLQRPAALRRRRTRHAVGLAGRARQRQRARAYGSTATRAASPGTRNIRTSSTCSRSASRRSGSSAPSPAPALAPAACTRIPPGHVEGYLEGFANLYTDCAEQIIGPPRRPRSRPRRAAGADRRGRRARCPLHHRGDRIQRARRRLDGPRAGALIRPGRRPRAQGSVWMILR